MVCGFAHTSPMGVAQAIQLMDTASDLYLAGDPSSALRHAKAALASLGPQTMAMTGGQVTAQQQVSHSAIQAFIELMETEVAGTAGSRRLRVQPVEYRNAGAPEC